MELLSMLSWTPFVLSTSAFITTSSTLMSYNCFACHIYLLFFNSFAFQQTRCCKLRSFASSSEKPVSLMTNRSVIFGHQEHQQTALLLYPPGDPLLVASGGLVVGCVSKNNWMMIVKCRFYTKNGDDERECCTGTKHSLSGEEGVLAKC